MCRRTEEEEEMSQHEEQTDDGGEETTRAGLGTFEFIHLSLSDFLCLGLTGRVRGLQPTSMTSRPVLIQKSLCPVYAVHLQQQGQSSAVAQAAESKRLRSHSI